MSLYGMMRTGVSGMAAQANRLSTLSDNIANSSTTGYKRARTEFSSLVIPSTPGMYNSGGVSTTVMNMISKPGAIQYTTSVTDLAVNGNGFFVVQDQAGTQFLTRAGAFVPDSNGQFVNASGFKLMAYDTSSGDPQVTANGFGGLSVVTINNNSLSASPTTSGVFSANLPAQADPVDPLELPSLNDPASTSTSKSSIVVYDNLGGEVLLDVYYSKTADNEWEVAVYNQADATNGGFPYANPALATETLTFDATTGKLDTASATGLSLTIPDGQAFELDLSEMTQLNADYEVMQAVADGNAPSPIEQVEIQADGRVVAQFGDGSLKELYRIPLATVQSPDRLNTLSGNVFGVSQESGSVRIGFAGESGLGDVLSGALEGSNVDIAEELTNMIEAQRSYTANSKSFQTGSELVELVVNLKR